MSGGSHWCERQQLQDDYDCIQRKGGGAIGDLGRGSITKIPHHNLRRQARKAKGKTAKIWLKLKESAWYNFPHHPFRTCRDPLGSATSTGGSLRTTAALQNR